MYKTSKLSNGLTIVTERIPQFRSVSAGLWFKAGSMYETTEVSGISHFIEHLLFKGTAKRSAKMIADAMDEIGGQINAFTAKEYTCCYFKVLDEHLDKGLDLLSDMTLNSSFNPTEIEKEKGVIAEEILMYEDSPEDVAYDLLSESMFKNHPLSQPILGNEDALHSFNREKISSFFQENYSPHSVVLSVAGNFSDTRLEDLINKNFECWKPYKVDSKATPGTSYDKDVLFRLKDIEQTHVCVGYPGIPFSDDRIYSVLVFNNIFGGSVSSRLFQKIREDRGLVYSVESHSSNYSIGGYLTVYAGMNPSNVYEVLSLIKEEVGIILRDGITSEELFKSKEQLKGSYILSLESTASRMNSLGRSQLLLGKTVSPDEVLEKINNVSIDDINEAIKITFSQGTAGISIIGKDDISKNVSQIFDVKQ